MVQLGGSFWAVGHNTRVRHGETGSARPECPHSCRTEPAVGLHGGTRTPPDPAPGRRPGSFVLSTKTAGQAQGLLGKSGPCSPSGRPSDLWPPPRAGAPEGTLRQVSPSTEARLFSRPQEEAKEGRLGTAGGGRTSNVEMEGRQAGRPPSCACSGQGRSKGTWSRWNRGPRRQATHRRGGEALPDCPHGAPCPSVGQRDRGTGSNLSSQLASRERRTWHLCSRARTGHLPPPLPCVLMPG